MPHTPGPWFEGGSLISAGCKCTPIAIVQTSASERGAKDYEYHGPSLEEHKANAHLIKAAPKLLEALKALFFFEPSGGPDDAGRLDDIRDAASAAIEEAEAEPCSKS